MSNQRDSIGTIPGEASVTDSEKSALDKLSAAAAHNALHGTRARRDELRPPQNTRTNILDHLELWAQGICDDRVPIFWLHGGAGAGKSAIMQTLAERCAAQGLALGSFFFSRSDPTRNTAEVLIPTLVYQLAQLFPSALNVLEPAIDRDPLIFKKSLKVQLPSLFVHPLQHLTQLGIISDVPHSPRVFFVDGLDECNDPAQHQLVIQMVATVCYEYRIPVKFLIASRQEYAIFTSLERYKQANRALRTILLSEDPDAEAGIRRFMEDEFRNIRLHHPFKTIIPPKWPDIYDINKLVWKSSFHDIYASTVMKYIWSAQENPVRSLQVVLGLEVSSTISPFSELDALYHHIFGSAAHREEVLQVLAHCIFASLPSLTGFVCMMLDCSLDGLTMYLADMAPLVVICRSRRFPKLMEVQLRHPSLRDFLCDQSRSGSLHVNEQAYLASKLARCFQLLDFGSQQQPLPRSSGEPYDSLVRQISETIQKSAHLVESRELLRRSRYSLRNFYQFYIQHWVVNPIPTQFSQFGMLLTALRSVETPDSDDNVYRGFVVDFFDTLESCANLQTPLGPAMLPLMFLGYPATELCQILSYRSPFLKIRGVSFMHLDINGLPRPLTFLDFNPMADIPSIRNHVDTSPQRLAGAAEAILEHLFDRARLHCTSKYSVHRSWLQRRKPGKHIATGAPRLASVIHTRCLSTLHLLEDPRLLAKSSGVGPFGSALFSKLRALSMVLGLKYSILPDELDQRQDEHQMVVNLLEALLWVLPKASFSDKILLYSKRAFPLNMYQRELGLVRRVRKCLDEYINRVQNAKVEGLDQRIANEDVSALIEKSRMFHPDA